MTDLETLHTEWTQATSELKYGVQRAFRTVLEAASDGQTTLVHGSDYRDGGACLVNTVGVMLTTGGGNGIPSAHFGEVVSLFDQLNREYAYQQINVDAGIVSPLAADILLHHFAPVKEPTVGEQVSNTMAREAFEQGVYREPSDDDMARDIANMFVQVDVPTEITMHEGDVQSLTIVATNALDG